MLRKWYVLGRRSCPLPARRRVQDALWTWVGASVSVLSISLLDGFRLGPQNVPLLMGSFGASAVLVFGALHSPLAQPRNLVGGHVVSALVGVSCQYLLGSVPWLAACTAVSLAILAMQATRTLHPPGGASALIAVVGGDAVHELGYGYAFNPCLLGACVMLVTGIVVNRLASRRPYPYKWW